MTVVTVCVDAPTHDKPVFDKAEFLALIPRMRSLARYLCRNATEMEDLTQDTLDRAWRSRDSFIAGTNMKAWVLTIMRNQFYSEKRRSWRMIPLDIEVAEETLAAVTAPDAAFDLEDVRRAMLELSVEQRQALNLITVVGLAYQDAADMCDCAIGTIKSRVSRARQSLTAILAEGDLTDEIRPAGQAMASIVAGAEQARRAFHPARPAKGAARVFRMAA